MKWLDETHGPRFELLRHFLTHMFDSEMSPGREWSGVAVGVFSLAVPAGILLVNPPYSRGPAASSPETLRALAMVDDVAMLTFLMAATGILALLVWQSLFPSRRDYLAFAGMPVRSRDIFGARFVSIAMVALTISIALSLLPSALTPHTFTARLNPGGTLPGQILARATAAGLATLTMFFAVTALQGVMINALPARWFGRLSGYAQGAMIAVFFITGLQSWSILGWREEAQTALRGWASWTPPVWFAGLHHAISGNRDPFYVAMANRALAAAAGAVLLSVLMYWLAFRRYRSLLLEAPYAISPQRDRKWSLIRLIAREPRREAILQFIAKVFSASRIHRLTLMGYAGGGFAVMLNAVLLLGVAGKAGDDWRHKLQFVVLYWPIGLTIVALAGVRHAFLIPVEWRANWMFQLTESQGRRQWMSAVERFATVFVVAPIHLIALPFAGALLGWPWALRVFAFQLLIALSVFEILFNSWQQLPFTCTYAPGKKPLAGVLASWIAVLGLAVPALARIVGGVSGMWQVSAFYFAIFCAAYLWLRRRRRFAWGDAHLIYEDRGEDLAGLGISEFSYRTPDPRQSAHSDQLEREAELPPNRAVDAGIGISRKLVSAFPREFQDAYGDALLETTEDVMEPTWRRDGFRGVSRLLLDLAVRIPAEYLAEFRQDLRYGIRTLAASPGFTAVAIVSLTLGIGVATCAYSETNGLLRDLPGVSNPEELVSIQLPISFPTYEQFREKHDVFSSAFAYVAPVPFAVSFGGEAERRWGHLATASYFSTLGVRPRLGRFFSGGDEAGGREPVVVVSSRFWEERMGSDRFVIGKAIRINGHSATIIGVGPKDFLGASPALFAADLWMPVTTDPRLATELGNDALRRRDATMFQMAGRLRPGIKEAAAEAELNAAAQQLAESYGDEDRKEKRRRVQLLSGGKIIPLRKQDIPFFKEFLLVLGGLLLLIACANIANLMLARAGDRRKEVAVRLALGASRARLIRQLLTESVLLAACAVPGAFLLSVYVMRMFSRLSMPLPIPITLDMTPDWRALLFTFAVTAMTGVAFGLAPALQATRSDLVSDLKETGALRFSKHRALNLRNLLVIGQMAASLMLLLLTGYMGLGIQSTLGVQEGFEPKDLYLISLDPVRDGYLPARAEQFFEQLRERLSRSPAVAAACLTDTVPASLDGNNGVRFSTPGESSDSAQAAAQWSRKHVVGRGYFETAGIRIMSGRGFDRRDEKDDSTAIVVSQEAVRRFWNGEDPVGRKIDLSDGPMRGGFGIMPGTIDFRQGAVGKARRTFEVVGVAHDVSEDLVASKKHPAIYFPLRPADYSQPSLRGVTLMVRGRPGVDAIGAVRREIAALDSELTTFNASSMPEHIAQYMSSLSAASWTYGFLGVFGLILASVGLAGVTAHSVVKRGHEMGIRMALGAQKRDVLMLVMKEGTVLVIAGTLIGLALALAGIRALSGIFFTVASVQGYDPVLLAGGPVLLACLALAACYVPARRSARIDPAVTLRTE
jgi:predicted permease